MKNREMNETEVRDEVLAYAGRWAHDMLFAGGALYHIVIMTELVGQNSGLTREQINSIADTVLRTARARGGRK